MLYEDYEKRLTEVVTDPDDAPIAIPDILAEVKSDLGIIAVKDGEIEDHKKTIEDRDAKIKDLQDKNTKLFLKVTESKEDIDDTVEDEEITIEDLFTKVKED